MVYAMGKINGSIQTLVSTLNHTLNTTDFYTNCQPPTLLLNHSTSLNDNEYEKLDEQLTRLVYTQIKYQSGIGIFWLSSLHFGIPLIFSIPIWICTSGIGK
jgi:hypothetical protein